MKKNPNINKYNKGLPSLNTEEPLYCIPYLKYSSITDTMKKRWKAQRRKYGFGDNETWSLDYTASVWLYSHIKMLLDIGGKTVNFEWDWWNDDFRKALQEVGVDTNTYKNDKQVFEYICKLFEDADQYSIDGDEETCLQLRQKAFKIFSVMMPRAWW